MREILFRGKRVDNGEWIEGFYCFTGQYHVIITGHIEDKHIVYGHYSVCVPMYVVDPATVGRYTGLKDKNRKRIFEGDVVRAVIVRDLGGGTENREETGIIGYDKIGMIGLIAKYVGTIPVWSDLFQELTLSGCIDDFWFEVFGNIHDNPELMEVR